MTSRLVKIAVAFVTLIVGVLALAWYDGGRETSRLIEKEVNLAEIGA